MPATPPPNWAKGQMKMTISLKNMALLSLATLGLLAVTIPADAKIRCQGNFQMSKYGPIATPYCEEEQIAKVAQTYGSKVTGAQVRNDPLTKVYLCQLYGHDVRLKGSCAGYSPDSYGRR
jgi:hypothetical protein